MQSKKISVVNTETGRLARELFARVVPDVLRIDEHAVEVEDDRARHDRSGR